MVQFWGFRVAGLGSSELLGSLFGTSRGRRCQGQACNLIATAGVKPFRDPAS